MECICANRTSCNTIFCDILGEKIGGFEVKLEVYFDYACPYCLRGHEHLCELLPKYPGLEIEWMPCEAHPRPGRYGPHSDWCAKGMLYARNEGADLMEYHSVMYRAALTDRRDIEDLRVVADLVGGLMDSDLFYLALKDGAYQSELAENNRLAWDAHRFDAVPSLCMNGDMLRSVEDIGLTGKMIADFLNRNYSA